VRQLAREIVAIEEDISTEHATGEEYHSVYTSLIQTHLPKLDPVGVIDYDANRKEVIPGQNIPAMVLVSRITPPIAEWVYQKPVSRFSGDITDSTPDSSDN
jgi:hypothetical protein